MKVRSQVHNGESRTECLRGQSEFDEVIQMLVRDTGADTVPSSYSCACGIDHDIEICYYRVKQCLSSLKINEVVHQAS
jgi:hypothetical protein